MVASDYRQGGDGREGDRATEGIMRDPSDDGNVWYFDCIMSISYL